MTNLYEEHTSGARFFVYFLVFEKETGTLACIVAFPIRGTHSFAPFQATLTRTYEELEEHYHDERYQIFEVHTLSKPKDLPRRYDLTGWDEVDIEWREL